MMKAKYWLAMGLFVFSASLGIARPEAIAAPPRKQSVNFFDKLLFLVNRRNPTDRANQSDVRGGIRRRMAGVRGFSSEPPIALIPEIQGRSIGSTIASHPTFWFYLPPMTPKLQSIQFRLSDKDKKTVWAVQSSVDSKNLESGLLKVVYDGQPLADGNYFWEFTYRNSVPTNSRGGDGLSGHLEKITVPNLVLNQESQSRLRTYAQNGIWHELLTELITLRQMNSGNSYEERLRQQQLTADFRSLIFESPTVKYSLPDNSSKDDLELMENIVNAKVLDCCQFVQIK
jgi:Domain of Unknown Function (DUF928)